MVNRPTPRPFPVLTLFTIYSTSSTIPAEDSASTAEANSDDIEGRKVLYFSAPTMEPLSGPRRKRLLGTVMGMADFAKMLSSDGPAVKSVNSLKQRMIWIEPEPGLFLHATIDLPRQSRHSRSASASDLKPIPPLPLEDDSLQAALRAEYGRYRLIHGSILTSIVSESRNVVMERLNEFWNGWNSRWGLERGQPTAFLDMVGGIKSTISSNALLVPLLTQFVASNPTCQLFISYKDSTLYYPCLMPLIKREKSKSPVLTESDLEALVYYLSSISTPCHDSHTGTPPPLVSTKRPKRVSKSNSTWNALTFGMGSYITPSLSNLPVISLPSTMAIVDMFIPAAASETRLNQSADDIMRSMQANGQKKAQKLEEKDSKMKNWGLRNVSWSNITSIGTLDAFTASPIPPVPALTASEVDSTAEEIISESSTTVSDPVPVETIQPIEVSKFESYPVYVGSAEESSLLLKYQRGKGELSIGLVVSSLLSQEDIDWLLNRSRKLLEAIELVLEISTSQQTPHQFLHKKSLSLDLSRWNATRPGSAGDAEELHALLRSHQLQKYSGILESFIRTSKSWVISQSSEAGEVCLILPPRVGVEGSLIDANNALQIHLQSVQT